MPRLLHKRASRILRAIPIAVLATIATTTAPAALLTPAAATTKPLPPLLPTTTAVTASPTASQVGTQVTFTATVSVLGLPGLGVTPTGPVTFTEFAGATSTTLGTVKLGKCPLTTCTATLSTSSLSVGTDTITAAYAGDALSMPSSNSTPETVTPIYLIGTPSNPVKKTCAPGVTCDTGPVYSDDGADSPFGYPSSSLDTAAAGSARTDTVTASLGGAALACSFPGVGEVGNYSVSAIDATKTVRYTVYDQSADTAQSDVDKEGGYAYVCFDSPSEFTGYYATGDNFTDTYADFANYGPVPQLTSGPYAGDYVGLLNYCGSTEPVVVPPCYTDEVYETNSPPTGQNIFYFDLNAPAGDPHIGGG